MAAQAYYLCASLLIRVHLRLHFLVPEQARNRRKGAMLAPGRRQSIQQQNNQHLPPSVTLFAVDDRTAALWLRPAGCVANRFLLYGTELHGVAWLTQRLPAVFTIRFQGATVGTCIG
jgi:hypothetical protein